MRSIIILLLFSKACISFETEHFCFQTVTNDIINIAESYFGYSLQLRKTDDHLGRVIVGAPKSNSTYPEHRNLHQPGAVFDCDLNSNCDQYVLDHEGNSKHNVKPAYHYMHHKDEGWLGSVLNGGDSINDPLIACSPRWINQYYSVTWEKKPFIQSGLCYFLNNARETSKDAEVLIPFQNSDKAYFNESYNYAYGEAGMSVLYIKGEQPEIIIGAPGVMDWQGTIVQYKNDKTNIIDRKRDGIVFEEKYSYFGYSVDYGRFVNSSNEKWYVTGAPRGSKLKGIVYFYVINDDRLDIKHTINGREFGEYFGYSLSVVDIENDGVDEIVIGSPMFSDDNKRTDSGRIYLYKFDENVNEFVELKINKQFMEKKSRFGTTIANIGDVNADGYNDIAVGAPFAYYGKGSVVVYYGTKSGLRWGENIFFNHKSFRGFGLGISKGVDIDNNGINDFAIGAPLSGHVIVVKSRSPVVTKLELTPNTRIFTLKTKQIDLKVCLTYSGQYAPEYLSFKCHITFNDDRFAFDNHLNTWNHILELTKSTKNCISVRINVHNTQPDSEQPLKLKLTHKLIHRNDVDCNPYIHKIEEKILKIGYSKDCENETACRSNLIVQANYNWTQPSLILGGRQRIQLNVYVTNLKDPAFKTKLYVTLPNIFVKFYKYIDKCTDTDIKNCFTVGNPLNRNETKKIVLYLELDTDNMLLMDLLTVELNVTSNEKDVDESDNVLKVMLPLGKEEDLELNPMSQPDIISYSEPSLTKSSKIKHILKIKNKGPTPLDHLKLEIYIPVTVEKKKLLKLERLNVYFKSYLSGISSQMSCNDDGITPMLESLDFYHINESLHPNEAFITCNSDKFNVDCRKFVCKSDKRFYIDDQILIDLPAYIELDKISKIDGEKSIINVHSHVIAYKSGRRTQSIDVVTKVQKTYSANIGFWAGIGIGGGILIILILSLILYKMGCFKRKDYKRQATLLTRTDETDE